MPKKRARWLNVAGFAAIVGLMVEVAGCGAVQHAKSYIIGDGCQANDGKEIIPLDVDQAANAATIAGVGYRRDMPQAAVTIAYATALQESKLQNLAYGDRDSVGIFQQRPSAGWGTARQLQDPVYATTQFFTALVKVPNYLKLPMYVAAQKVQHSADGTAYIQYEQVAGQLSDAFTGHAARAISCWYSVHPTTPPNLAQARTELRRTFGPLKIRGSAVHVSHAGTGWAVASWTVAHAKTYGISQVRFAGYRWRATSGDNGWQHDTTASGALVELT